MTKFYLLIVVILFVLLGCNPTDNSEKAKSHFKNDTLLIETLRPNLLFGMNQSKYKIEQSVVNRNNTLSDILFKYNVSAKTIDSIVKLSDDIFNLKHIKANNPYTIFLTKDTAHQIVAFIYEVNPMSYFKILFKDSLQLSVNQRKVTRQALISNGVINSSLWNAITDNNISPDIAIQLSEIYAWSIDFFGLQKGDAFSVFYDVLIADSHIVKIDKVDAALFKHNETLYYAFLFNNEYFDEEGNSLRKTFLKAPIRFSRISSRFSNSRYHPILKIYRPHHGVDYAAPKGTPVYALGDGKIIKKGYAGGGGNCIKIKHNSVYTTSYMHLWKYADGIHFGKMVIQGELIGYVGSTGLATGPHLDFRVYRNGQAIDPLKLESPSAEPVPDSLMLNYNILKDSLKIVLDNDFKKNS